MKKKFLFFFSFIIITSAVKAQDTTSTGLLYGHNHSYYLTAPLGWVMDHESGKDQGLTAVFYPKGSSWAGAETVMYASYASYDTTKKETVKNVITTDSLQFLSTSPDLKVSKQDPVNIGRGKKAMVYSYSDNVNSNYETVGYIAEKKGVVMIIISSRNKNGCINNYKTFEALIKSYKFLTDKVNVD